MHGTVPDEYVGCLEPVSTDSAVQLFEKRTALKNNYCDLSHQQIRALPERFQGLLLSPFQFNLRDGMVAVPEDAFKEMIDLIAEYATNPAVSHTR
jgi:hypothetical protein